MYHHSSTVGSFLSSNRNSVNQIASDLLRLTGSSSNLHYSSSGLSSLENSILRSSNPIELSNFDQITVNGERGIWANKAESQSWRGALPIEQYLINHDNNPEIIHKKPSRKLQYVQDLAVKYLKPPTPPPHGDIVIKQEANIPTAPAPPLIIRQQPPRPITPETLVVREQPPPPPPHIPSKFISIPGKRIPPPPRKLVVERLPELPAKPQNVYVERWLPYNETTRRVVYQPAPPDPIIPKPRNLVVQWESPDVDYRRDFKFLGVSQANPLEYVRNHPNVIPSHGLPAIVNEIKTPSGLVLAAHHTPSSVPRLTGDVEALNLIDLDRAGLSEYKYLQRNYSTSYVCDSSLESIISDIFSKINLNHNGQITKEEAEKVILKLNSRFGRSYGEDEVNAFLNALDTNYNGAIDFNEFKRAFENLNSF